MFSLQPLQAYDSIPALVLDVSKEKNPPMELSGKYQLWLSNRDKAGEPIDPAILQAAQKIGNYFFAYRRGDLQCESTANSLAQDAVESISHAIKKRSVPPTHMPGYLFLAYKRLVNRYLTKQSKSVLVSPRGMLERLEGWQHNPFMPCRQEDRVYLREVLDVLDPEVRAILAARIEGFEMKEIARQRGLVRETLNTRYRTGLHRAKKQLRAPERIQ
jgi:DNA-directed RNA polymerase specialized sigma24 family protein